MTGQQRTSHRFWFAALLIFALLATIQITFLTIQNRELKQAINAQRPAPPDELKTGEQVRAFDAVNGDGTKTKVSYDDADYLVLITSTKCQWCTKTLPVWKDIAAQAEGKGVRVIAVSIDGEGEIKNYKEANGLNFEVVNFPDAEVQSSYKAYSTPQTIFVERGGKVGRVWQGALSEDARKEVMRQIS